MHISSSSTPMTAFFQLLSKPGWAAYRPIRNAVLCRAIIPSSHPMDHQCAADNRSCVERNHYQALLRRNYIAMHATVMYRRPIFESVGEFSTSLKACEDYDLYLRIARRVPVYCHDKVIAEYRQHGANMSRNHQLMLKSAVSVLQSQRKYIKGHKESEKAYQTGMKFWQTLFGDPLLTEVRRRLAHGEWRQAMREMLAMQQSYPEGIGTFASWVCRRVLFRVSQAIFRRAKTFMKNLRPTPLHSWLRVWLKRYTSGPRVGRVRFGSLRRLTPISRAFGFDRGLPIDRYYIERFLSAPWGRYPGRCAGDWG